MSAGHADGAPRFSAFKEVEMLPGMMGNGVPTSNHSNGKPHSNIIVSGTHVFMGISGSFNLSLEVYHFDFTIISIKIR